MLIVALLVGAFWLFGSGVVGQATTTEEIVQPLDGATLAEVVIAPAVGTLRVESLSESANLVEGTIYLQSGERLRRDVEIEDETATFKLHSEGNFVGPWGSAERGWDLGLNADVLLDLETSIALGQSDLDLTDLMLKELEASMALGQIVLVLPAKGDFEVQVEGAIGQITIVIPEGLEARVQLDTALVSKQLPTNYRQQDNVYTSPGYAEAEGRVDLTVDLAMGSVVIRH
jgi:hypothetical protein